jgi:cell division protein FtsZ
MVDEKLDDQVWVTVVATGYDNGRQRRRDTAQPGESQRNGLEGLREPRGEPRVSRMRERRPSSSPMELDVPEFIPRR